MKRIMVTLGAAGVMLVVAGSVSACGTTTGTALPAPQPSFSSAPAVSASRSDVAASVDSSGLCGWLAAELPAVQAAAVNAATTARGTNIGAETQFAIDYGSWIAEDPVARKLDDATHLDTVTTTQCPSIRTQYAKALGSDSFSGALGP